MASQSIVAGIYRHYKGQDYEVLDIGTHTETGEEFVVYRGLYGGYCQLELESRRLG